MGDRPRERVPETDARTEFQRAVEMLDRAAAQRVDVKGLGDRLRTRLVAPDGAPAGAGWSWLAAREDRGAQAAVPFERGRQ